MARDAIEPDDVWETFVAGFAAFATVTILLWLLGVEIATGQAIWLFVGLMLAGLMVRNTVDVSVGFALFTLAILVALASLLTAWVSEPFAPFVGFIEGLLGAEIASMHPLQLGVVIVVLTFLMIAFRYKITGKKKFVGPIVDATLREMTRYARVHLNIARVALVALLAILVIGFQQVAGVLGEAGNVAAEIPVVIAQLVTVMGGYLSLGGELPYIGSLPLLGDLDAEAFLFLGIIVLAAAVAVKWTTSGPVSQFLKNRGQP